MMIPEELDWEDLSNIRNKKTEDQFVKNFAKNESLKMEKIVNSYIPDLKKLNNTFEEISDALCILGINNVNPELEDLINIIEDKINEMKTDIKIEEYVERLKCLSLEGIDINNLSEVDVIFISQIVKDSKTPKYTEMNEFEQNERLLKMGLNPNRLTNEEKIRYLKLDDEINIHKKEEVSNLKAQLNNAIEETKEIEEIDEEIEDLGAEIERLKKELEKMLPPGGLDLLFNQLGIGYRK